MKSIQALMDKAEKSFTDVNSLDLPPSITALFRKSRGGGDVELSEESITKARGILNGLIEAAQKELDDKTLQCKAFHNRNRELSRQIQTDLARLSEQITYLKGLEAEANVGIADSDQAITLIEEESAEEATVYNKIRAEQDAEMSWRRNDLRVAEFILRLTKCKASFLEAPAAIRHCEDDEGHSVRFANDHLHMAALGLREESRKLLEQALLDTAMETTTTDATSPPPVLPAGEALKDAPLNATPTQGSSTPASARKQANKCTTGKPNCGLLHDNMSLMWGEMKDAVDKLTEEMRRDANKYKKKEENWNQQIQMYSSAKSTHGQSLAEASSNIAADQEEQAKKQQENRRVEAEYVKVWGECESTIQEILFTKICGVKSVRGELHKKSAEVKPTDIIDSDVGDWIAGECTVPCDDNLVGGTQVMTREVIQKRNENGIKLPSLQETIKCGMFPCPVDCKQTPFDSFSTCSKDCGGGIKTRSRTIEVKPKNGGRFCDAPTESNVCNSGSCDRDCDLTPWKYRPCSVACGRKGYIVRKKHVTRKARANGKCPNKRSRARYGKKKCNRVPCFMDEACIAKQDVIIAVDGSGSVTEKGFEVLREFTQEVASRFRGEVEQVTEVWSTKGLEEEEEHTEEPTKVMVPAVQMGVIQFGNGVLADDGTVSSAEITSGLSNEIKAAEKAIGELTWQKGFTNMAQVFTAADSVFMNGGRKNAQSVLIIITDGKPSFKFQTKSAVKKLRRKGVKVVIVAVKSFLGKKEKKLLKTMVSKPSATHFIHVPGLKTLKWPQQKNKWAGEVLIHSCPKTVSEKKEKQAEAARAKQNEIFFR